MCVSVFHVSVLMGVEVLFFPLFKVFNFSNGFNVVA